MLPEKKSIEAIYYFLAAFSQTLQLFATLPKLNLEGSLENDVP